MISTSDIRSVSYLIREGLTKSDRPGGQGIDHTQGSCREIEDTVTDVDGSGKAATVENCAAQPALANDDGRRGKLSEEQLHTQATCKKVVKDLPVLASLWYNSIITKQPGCRRATPQEELALMDDEIIFQNLDDVQAWVYLVTFPEVPGIYKIGSTQNLSRRLRVLVRQYPNHSDRRRRSNRGREHGDPVVIHLIPCEILYNSILLEHAFHKHFSEKLVSGEWFRLTPDDVAVIRNVYLPKVDDNPFPDTDLIITQASNKRAALLVAVGSGSQR